MSTHQSDDLGRFTKDQIREAVMTWDQGCPEGKARFLQDALGIEMEPITVRVVVEVEIDRYDDHGEEIDSYEVVNRLQHALDYNIGTSDFEVSDTLGFSVSSA
jgi:hypothetical protein